MIVTYSSNNSGGRWWLEDKDWVALEKAGWIVHWYHAADHSAQDHTHEVTKGSFFDRHSHHLTNNTLKAISDGSEWLGAKATSASIEGKTLGEAIRSWENVTGESSTELGCGCCGPPHSFSFEDDSGNTDYWSPDAPIYGDPYEGD